jgi:hypothetical protein
MMTPMAHLWTSSQEPEPEPEVSSKDSIGLTISEVKLFEWRARDSDDGTNSSSENFIGYRDGDVEGGSADEDSDIGDDGDFSNEEDR